MLTITLIEVDKGHSSTVVTYTGQLSWIRYVPGRFFLNHLRLGVLFFSLHFLIDRL